MKYEVDQYPIGFDFGRIFCVTLDGEYVPILQAADDEKGIVKFPALSDNLELYFDHDRDDWPILTRTGNVEFHFFETDNQCKDFIGNLVRGDKVCKPFPYEITEGMKISGGSLKDVWL